MQQIRQFAFGNVIPRVITGRCLSTTTTLNMLKVNDKIPDVVLFENDPGKKINAKDVFGKGKSVIFAVPGAFTPTCSNQHAPGFIQNIDQFEAKGVHLVACISVNDPFVMAAWGKSLGADGKVRMLADTGAEFTKALDMGIEIAPLGGLRSKRYAMVVIDGIVTAIQAEPDNTGLACSRADDIMKLL